MTTLKTRLSTLDFPSLMDYLTRGSVGYDDIFTSLNRFASAETAKYPAHDIIRHSDTSYSVEVAVAGFKESEIEVTVDNNVLTIKGRQEDRGEVDYLYQGISTRSFVKSLNLSPYVQVKGANLADGLLKIELEVVIPDELKPRKIAIDTQKKLK